jgi:glycosyltransferase involved in cell wall biosynthesis
VNVLHLVSHNLSHPYFVDLARHLNGPDLRLFVGSLRGRGDLQRTTEAEGIETLSLDCERPRDFPRAVLRLVRWLREKRIDVVHTHLDDASLVGLTAARLAGVRGRVMTRHHSDERVIYGRHKRLLLDRFIGRHLARHIIALSLRSKRALLEIDGIAEEKIRLVPTGYDWSRLRSNPEDALAVRRALGIEGCLVLSLIGNIAWVSAQNTYLKGQDRLLQAYASARLPEHVRILIVGRGEQGELKGLAARLGIAERCLFLGHRQDILDVISASDLIVHPSLSEAQCHVLIEAMALGRPVIASTVGAAEEMVVPGQNGWLIPPRDQAALVAALREAVSDPERLRAYGESGRRVIQTIYPLERMVRGYEAVYREELAASAPA